MPRRQAHGRPFLPTVTKTKKLRSGKPSNGLDALAKATEQVDERTKGVRTRHLDFKPVESGKRNREEYDQGGEDGGSEVSATRDKRVRHDEFDSLSASEESEKWHEGVHSDDEDSEINSDEAFGESDEDLDGLYTRTAKSKKKEDKDGDEDGDANEGAEVDDDDQSLGSDAIDLATALDSYEKSSDEQASGDDHDESNSGGDDTETDSDSDQESAKAELRNLLAGFGGTDEQAPREPVTEEKSKISLSDLGLSAVKSDMYLHQSLKLLKKEAKKPKNKLAVPLARRQQDRILRAAAFAEASKSLDKWTESVKHMSLEMGEFAPLQVKGASSELETAILSIIEQSGLGPTEHPKKPEDAEAAAILQAEKKAQIQQRRVQRELQSREAARAKRIKKIKSKTYRRIHRKAALKDAEAAANALREAGEVDTDEEREQLERQRAQARMGKRVRESRRSKRAGRAVWDEDYKEGLQDASMKAQELRRRLSGVRDRDSEDSEDSDSSETSLTWADARTRLLRQLDMPAVEGEERSKLMSMRFMQNAEDKLKKANDELVKEIRKELRTDSEEDTGGEEDAENGRRQYGLPGAAATPKPVQLGVTERTSMRSAPSNEKSKDGGVDARQLSSLVAPVGEEVAPGAWTRARESRSKSRKHASRGGEIDVSKATILRVKSKPQPAQPSQSKQESLPNGLEDDSEEGDELGMAIRDTELIRKAFAGDDVVEEEFLKEKTATQEQEGDTEMDMRLPGWGSWVGDGVKSHRTDDRFVKKTVGVKPQNRKDFKLRNVILSEKQRNRKNEKYMASQLPYPFESREQYERSLRLPIGSEWQTKESFQEATKPRIILKQGLITPMSKPLL